MKQSLLFLLSAILFFFSTSGDSVVTPTQKKAIEAEIINEELCEWDAFKPSCPRGHVVFVIGATYGRMKANRCITSGVGEMGCGANVTQQVAGICTGRGSCTLKVIDLYDLGECHKDYKSYLEVQYKCIEVITSLTGCPHGSSSSSSSSSDHHAWNMVLTTPDFMDLGIRPAAFESISKIVGGHYIDGSTSGVLSSSVALETGDGTHRCPWIFRLHPPQTLNLTFHQFTNQNSASLVRVTEFKTPSSSRHHGYEGGDAHAIDHLIHVTSGQPSTYVSGSGVGEIVLVFLNSTDYVSNSSGSDVGHHHHHHRHHHLRPPPPPLPRHARRDVYGPSPGRQQDPHGRHLQHVVMETAAVLIEFRVNGCLPLNLPPNTWSSTDGHVTNVTCNDTGEYFRLTCAGNEWSGRLGNCSEVSSRRRSDMGYWNEPMQHGILLVVLLGVMIGIAIGFFMLMAVLAYMKKFRNQRRIRSHLSNNFANCRDVTADLSLFDLYDPSGPLTHDHHHLSQSQHHHHQYHHQHHRHQHHHHQEFNFPEEEDEDEELKTGIYGGSLLEGNAVSMTTPGDEINRRNWIWSTWVRRSEVGGLGVNCGRDDFWNSKTGAGKAASTMTMMMRKMTGRMKKDRADVFSGCSSRRHDNEEMETANTTIDTSGHVIDGVDELEDDDKTEAELNFDTTTDSSAFAGKEFSNNKQQQLQHQQQSQHQQQPQHQQQQQQHQQACASKLCSDPNNPHFFKPVDDSKLNPTSQPISQLQNSSLNSCNKSLAHNQLATNCNSADIQYQHIPQQQQQATSNSFQQQQQQQTHNSTVNQVACSNNIQSQVGETRHKNKDGLYGVCFTTDAPYNFVASNATQRRQQFDQHNQQTQQLVQRRQLQPLQQHLQQLQQNFVQQPSCSVHSPNVVGARYPYCPHHNAFQHHRNNNNNNVGGDDDDDSYDCEREVLNDANKIDFSSGNLQHHHHHHQHQESISSAGIHHDHHNHHQHHHHHHQNRSQFNRGQHHYHHRLYNHHHHHQNFMKPDLVTQTPPPLPVKCIKTNHRCPLCSVNNLSVTSSSSAIL